MTAVTRALVAASLLLAGCGLSPGLQTPGMPDQTASPTTSRAAAVPTGNLTPDQAEQRITQLEATWTAQRDKRAIFATAYRISTINIRAAIAAGKFEDADRLNRAVVAFATLYFHAVDADQAGDYADVPPAWERAFSRGRDPHATVAEVLILSMNGHIVRDLPFAAASLAPMNDSWHTDFTRLNDVLEAEVPQIREAIVQRYGTWSTSEPETAMRWDDLLAGKAVAAARAVSWQHALDIAADPAQGGARTEAFATKAAADLDQPDLLWALWQWLKATTDF